MSPPHATLGRVGRKINTAAAYGSGGLGLLGALGGTTYGLLRLQARLARRTILARPVDPLPDSDGRYGTGTGEPLSFVVIGDSSAAGYGATVPDETPGALMATGLAEATGRPVQLTTVAVTGAQSSDLARQVDEALPASPDLAYITIGGNDVTHRISPDESCTLLGDAVRRLVDAGAVVVVGTCPDLGTIRPIQPPLRWLARTMSRSLAAAQTTAVLDAGGRTVSLGSLLGPEFAATPGQYFSADQFHPSPAGYRKAAEAMLPSLLAALGVGDEDDDVSVLIPTASAAATAASTPGTEATGDRGGRWASLRRRLPGRTDFRAADATDTVSVTNE